MVAFLAASWGCSSGGNGSSTTLAPVAAWEQFRHDSGNTGQGSGLIEDNTATVRMVQVDDAEPAPISASPAIGVDGTIYIGSEGGTLRAVKPDDLSTKWKVTACSACPDDEQALGPLISSPAVYTLDSSTSVFVGSDTGRVFLFEVGSDDQPTCSVCFRPRDSDFGAGATIVDASFVSSPNFTINPVTLTIAGIFIGAQLDIERGGSTHTVGKLYALNSDGSQRWQFPGTNDPDIGPVTSSPAFGLGATLYFTTADTLYALASNGDFKWTFPLPGLSQPGTVLAPSPVTVTFVYLGTASGEIFAINPDGSLRWRTVPRDDSAFDDDSGFRSSLAVGVQAPTTPSPQPTPEPDTTSTPTRTPTPVRAASTLFGVTEAGTLAVLEASSGTIISPSGSLPVPVSGAVLSSPALSADSYLVFGTTEGLLHAVNTSTGVFPTNWTGPVQLGEGAPIRSSPTIDVDGIIYVGADDGILYVVGDR